MLVGGGTRHRGHQLSGGSRVLKRALDFVLAGIGIVLALPLLALIAVAVRFTSGRPILHRARRIGRGGSQFTMFKFRTMVRDAEFQVVSLAHVNLGVGMVRIPNDPRVTAFGRWLRRSSLDELPQLWNVLRGDMSIVGPRPHETHELARDLRTHGQRLAVRPGLTGLWQVRARHDPSVETRIHWDLEYLTHQSLLLDLRIILRTVPAVIRGLLGRATVPAKPTGADRTGASPHSRQGERPSGDGPQAPVNPPGSAGRSL